jgi:hypothetical protein
MLLVTFHNLLILCTARSHARSSPAGNVLISCLPQSLSHHHLNSSWFRQSLGHMQRLANPSLRETPDITLIGHPAYMTVLPIFVAGARRRRLVRQGGRAGGSSIASCTSLSSVFFAVGLHTKIRRRKNG